MFICVYMYMIEKRRIVYVSKVMSVKCGRDNKEAIN